MNNSTNFKIHISFEAAEEANRAYALSISPQVRLQHMRQWIILAYKLSPVVINTFHKRSIKIVQYKNECF